MPAAEYGDGEDGGGGNHPLGATDLFDPDLSLLQEETGGDRPEGGHPLHKVPGLSEVGFPAAPASQEQGSAGLAQKGRFFVAFG